MPCRYDCTVAIADALAWTKTNSWTIGGGYSTRHETERLAGLLEPWRMDADRWQKLLEAVDAVIP